MLEEQKRATTAAAAAELQALQEAGDPTALGAAITRAEEVGVDQQEIAKAKRVQFQLENERKEQAKRDKRIKEAQQRLESAVNGESIDALTKAIGAAEKAGVAASKLETAHARLNALQDAQKQEALQLALKALEALL